MANETVLPGSVAKAAHVKALDLMIGQRFDAIDTGVVLINLIDSAPAAALPFLAQQFNLLGYRGWKFMDTEDKQRNLLKQAIELNRYAGTSPGIEQALIAVGIVGAVEIQERTVPLYDGSWLYDGHVFYGNHWAYFRVLLDIANINGLSVEDVRGVINVYKGTRNWLLDLAYKFNNEDELTISDQLQIITELPLDESLQISDTLDIQII